MTEAVVPVQTPAAAVTPAVVTPANSPVISVMDRAAAEMKAADAAKSATTPVTPVAKVETPVVPVTPAAEVKPDAKAGETKVEAPKMKRLISEETPAEVVKPETPAAEVKPLDYKLEALKDGNVLEAASLPEIEATAKTLGLSKEVAQKLLVEQNRLAQAQIARTNDEWYNAAQADTEIGGAKMPQTLASVKRSMQAFMTADERKAVANSPFANNPLFLRIMSRVAASLPTEDKVYVPNTVPAGPKMPTNAEEAARLMYGNLKRK